MVYAQDLQVGDIIQPPAVFLDRSTLTIRSTEFLPFYASMNHGEGDCYLIRTDNNISFIIPKNKQIELHIGGGNRER